MEIRHLKLVVTVAERGSLTEAGKSLHLTQSALSHQLKELEQQLGTALFHRINKKMVLTQAGEMVLKTAHVVLDEVAHTEQAIHRLISGEAGVLRLSTSCYTCYHWLPNLLQTYNEVYPKVEVQIVAEATRQPLQALRMGKLDVAVSDVYIDDPNLTFTKLFEDELVVIMHPDHRLSAKLYLDVNDFSDEHLITYTVSTEQTSIFQQVTDIKPKKVSKIQLTEAIIEMVKAGLGIAAMARWAVRPYVELGQVVPVSITKSGVYRSWYAVTLRGQTQPAYLEKFVEHLVSHPLT